MIFTLAIIALFAMPPLDGALEDRFDRIELNHYYDDDGEHVFDQMLFQDWSDEHARFIVQAWRLWKKPNYPSTRFNGEVELIFDDGEVSRRVRAKVFGETWTQHDPEMRDRGLLPKEQRRELLQLREQPHAGDLELP